MKLCSRPYRDFCSLINALMDDETAFEELFAALMNATSLDGRLLHAAI